MGNTLALKRCEPVAVSMRMLWHSLKAENTITPRARTRAPEFAMKSPGMAHITLEGR
jgi:hypothetical protein